MRKTGSSADSSGALQATFRSAAVVTPEAQAEGQKEIEGVFGKPGSGLAPEQLPARLEQTFGLGRLSWPLTTIRPLADLLLRVADGRRKNAPHEARWLNLTGFCLRPGFGLVDLLRAHCGRPEPESAG